MNTPWWLRHSSIRAFPRRLGCLSPPRVSEKHGPGTAGLHARCLLRLQTGAVRVRPKTGNILVNRSDGRRGSIAVAQTGQAENCCMAPTGRVDKKRLPRHPRAAGGGRGAEGGGSAPRKRPNDGVGGDRLSAATLKATRYGGTVTCCGLVGSPRALSDVFPFICAASTCWGSTRSTPPPEWI